MDHPAQRCVKSSYDRLLAENNLLYMPSCLIVEMMHKLYSETSRINLSGKLRHLVPDLLVLLRRLSRDLKVTAAAYGENRMRFFIGDWRDDKIRARKLFFDLIARLGFMSRMTGSAEKRLIFQAIDDLTHSWSDLDRLVEEQMARQIFPPHSRNTSVFRRTNHNLWCEAMAKLILDLDAALPPDEANAYLILLCYNRVKNSVLQAIDALQKRRGKTTGFSPDRIVCISKDNLPDTCPTCALATDALGRQGEENTWQSFTVTPKPRRPYTPTRS